MSKFIPNGSYQKTASQINSNLYGKAQRRDQTWIAAGFNITGLSGGLVNWDGALQPENAPLPTAGFVPDGSYKKTTQNIAVTLTAYCQKKDGSWQWSSLDITNHKQGDGDIANIDGILKIQK
ncbi:cyanovirin [Pectobacterium polaris]|uniref:cyanovirin n=1 Tax=Pectobacterium polaris TaxID=2042057 RepID=UPI0023B1DEAE|nr:cyanovirin [Pectobacterium polaris]MDE8754587.1 cyanovirin [Pectobacterium polaris]